MFTKISFKRLRSHNFSVESQVKCEGGLLQVCYQTKCLHEWKWRFHRTLH